MQLVQWNPFREMEDFFSRVSRLPAEAGRSTSVANWAPAVDIAETDKEYVVKAELPGLKKEEVKVTVDKGVLTLSGERKYEKDNKDQKNHRVERFYGKFERSFSVPEDVLTDKITADCRDGVVSVRLPKTDIKKAKTAQIPVQ